MKHALEIWRDELVETCVLEGRHEEALKIAAGMKSDGMDVYAISRLTGLTIDEILQM